MAEIKSEKQTKAKAIDRFIAELVKRDRLLAEFDNKLWLTVVENATVQRDGRIVFRLYDGTVVVG